MSRQIFTPAREVFPCAINTSENEVHDLIRPLRAETLPGEYDVQYETLLTQGYWPSAFKPERPPRALTFAFSKNACSSCNQCLPSRINLSKFEPPLNLIEKFRAEGNWTRITKNLNADEHIALLKEYYAHAHSDFPVTELIKNWKFKNSEYKAMEFRAADSTLIASSFVRRFNRAAVGDQYYYDPKIIASYRRPGALITSLIACKLQQDGNADYLYIGNWSRLPSPLSPKARLKGLEIFENGEWRTLGSKERNSALNTYFKAFPPNLSEPV